MRCNYIIGVALVYLLSSVCHAGVFERDLVPGSGDGLLTYDNENEREWLDLSQSLLIDLGETDSGGNFSFDFDRDVVPELLVGGSFEGFMVAKSDDINALAESAGIILGTLDFNTNQAATAILIDLLGPTFGSSPLLGSQQAFSTGILDEPGIGVLSSTAFFQFQAPPLPSIQRRAGLITGQGAASDAFRFPNVGVMFYRQIPEPSSIALFCTAFLLFVDSKLRRCQL